VDVLVVELDAVTARAGERWNLHRAAMDGRWVITLGLDNGRSSGPFGGPAGGRSGDDGARTVSDDRITGVLRAALASRRTRAVPRRPAEVQALSVRKAGNRWEVVNGEGRVVMWADTKKSTVAAVERYRAAQEMALAGWLAEWGPVVDGDPDGVGWHWGPS
jgi:hypothetical protein